MYIISFDVASKSLAVSLLLFDDNHKNKILIMIDKMKKINQEIKCIDFNSNINSIYEILTNVKIILIEYLSVINNMITPIFLDVVDLIPGEKIKNTTVITRSNRLKSYLNHIDNIIQDEIYKNKKDNNIPIKVLLEYQMGPNDKSRNVCSQILYNYSRVDDINFKSVNTAVAQIDNSDVSYSVEIVGPSIKNKINIDKYKDHQFFLNKYTNKYDANKKHSSHNFLKWIEMKSLEHMIKKIPKKNIDDIADSVTMSLSWFKYNIYSVYGMYL